MDFRRPVLASVTTWLVVTVAATTWALAAPTAMRCAVGAEQPLVTAAPSESAGFVAGINQLRVSQGLNALSVNGNLADVAQEWANSMAHAGAISHRADLRSGLTGNWTALGENVGVGPTVSSLMDAFIASPGHYKNLVDPRFTHVGVGTVRVGALLYTAHEFMATRPTAVSAPVPTPSAPVTNTPAPRRVAPATPVTPAAIATPPTTAAAPAVTAPAPAPASLPTEVKRLPTDEQLHDRGENDQQQQESKRNRRCRSHVPNLRSVVK